MAKVGVFTSEDAREMLAAFRWLKQSGFMSQAGQKAPNKDLARTPIYIKNVSGEAIPAYACMQAVGTVEIGGQNFVEVDKPVDEDSTSGHYLFNGFESLGVDELGIAYDGPFVRVISESLTFAAGDKFGPKAGSWKVQEGGTLLIAAGPDDIRTDVIRCFVSGGGGGGGGGTQFVIFQILERSGTEEALSNDCVDKLMDADLSYEAKVLWRPCGIARVAEETSAGTIIVHDHLGSFLEGREDFEAQGRVGVAVYMKEEGGYECEWVITFIDWWREIQVISDVIHTDSEIRFKVKKVQVWDDCDLPDIVIPLIDCEDTSG